MKNKIYKVVNICSGRTYYFDFKPLKADIIKLADSECIDYSDWLELDEKMLVEKIHIHSKDSKNYYES